MEFLAEKKFTTRELYLIEQIRLFFTEDKITDILIPLLEQKAPISLRGIDWLITNYAKKLNIICHSSVRDGCMVKIFNSYKRALNFYKRKHFDPFRRRMRLTISLSNGTVVETTIGQTVFLMWASRLGVLEYAYKHAIEIETDMNKCTAQLRKERKKQLSEGKTQRRKELSKAPSSQCVVYCRRKIS
jgi:hypothetical protein